MIMTEILSKVTIREKVWNDLEKKDLVNFPRPCQYRIPNFKGTDEAAQKLAALPIFQEAKVIKVNPDKPQDHVRFLALEQCKQLLVPTPRLRNGLFNMVVPPAPAEGDVLSQEQLRVCASSRGLRKYSKSVELAAVTKVQLVVIGAVAVSPSGICIGKGEGYGDLEFAIMQSLGVVDHNTQVVVTVHDAQVLDIPESLVTAHDVPVDWIVTPTRVLEVLPRRTRPQGLLWELLSRHKFKEVEVLGQLRAQDQALGRPVQLKEDVLGLPEGEELPAEERPRPVRFKRPIPARNGSGDGADGEKAAEDAPERRRRQGGRGKGRRAPGDGDAPLNGKELSEDADGAAPRRRRRPRGGERSGANGDGGDRPPRRTRHSSGDARANNMPALYVSALPRRGLRVSEFKAALRNEHDVHPLRVTWGGGNGRAFLIFRELAEMNDALTALADLTLMERKATVEVTHRTIKAFNMDGGAPPVTAAETAESAPAAPVDT